MALIKAKQLDATDNYSFNTVTLAQTIPTLDAQAASKAYVDSVVQGLDIKQSARAASSANINLASAPSSIDGVTLAANDRVLIKNQTSGEENGIYQFNGVGSAMTRTTDADTSAEVTANLFCFVEEGTTNADTGWVLATDNPITLGTTSLTFSQFSGAGTILAGNGLSKTGSVLDVNVDNSTLEINSDILRVKDLGITNAKINDLAASKVTIVDAGGYFSSTEVEGALQELGNSVSTLPTNSAITDLQAAVGSSTGTAGLDYSSNNYVTDATSLETAVGALDAALFSEAGTRAAADTAIRSDLASTANTKGASLVGIEDAGNYFSGVTVEAALAELGLQLSGAGNVDSRLDNIEAVIGSTTGLAGIDFTSNHVVADATSFETAISALDAFFGNVTTADLNKLNAITSTATQIDNAVTASHSKVYQAITVTSNGQTAFTLTSTPKADGAVELFVNGQSQANAVDYTVSGTSLTWTSSDFSLATTDSLIAVYDA